MKLHIRLLPGCVAAALPLLLLCSCVEESKKPAPPKAAALEAPQQHRTIIEPSLLPDRFQQTGYMIREEKNSDSQKGGGNPTGMEGLQLKVGSNIATTQPIPLREAMKAIVRTKNMSLSWAPDVDQELLVDIDVRANDNFYEAIDNILRQLDYFQEVEGSTLIIKFRETKQYHIAMPFIKQDYKSSTGSSSSTISSSDNKFDIWENIQNNIDSIIKTWTATATTPEVKDAAVKPDEKKGAAQASADTKKTTEEATAAPAPLARRVSSTDSTYTIDKPVGLITVNAPKSLQKRIDNYLSSLEKELYKQIIIEAKIIEVQLNDSSSLGINWNLLLQGLALGNTSYSKDKLYVRKNEDKKNTDSSSDSKDNIENSTTDSTTKTSDVSSNNDGTTTTTSDGTTVNGISETKMIAGNSIANTLAASTATIISGTSTLTEGIKTGVTLTGFNFTSFIKALQGQGQTSILSNPKISVMNGQPALISVGRNVTYIKDIKSETSGQSGAMSTTVTTADILSGIGLALSAVVKKDNEIVMNLVPITSELSEPIEYVEVGQGNKIGLPVVNKREMSTMVKIKDGSMLVVGGLISEVDTKNGEYLPGAKDIPYLKYLFGYEEKQRKKRELIILLRPRIIN